MSFNIEKSGDSCMISIVGKLTATDLRDSLRGVVQKSVEQGAQTVYINMGEVTNIDSTGVGELVAAFTYASNHNAALLLYDVGPKALELLEITQLTSIFRILPKNDPEIQAFH
jgi:anti-sigma B factor antagonist